MSLNSLSPAAQYGGNYLGHQLLGNGFLGSTSGRVTGNLLSNFLSNGSFGTNGLLSGTLPGGQLSNMAMSRVPGIGSYFSPGSQNASLLGGTAGNILGKALPLAGIGLGAYNGINKMRNGQGYGTMNGMSTGAGIGSMIAPGIGTAAGAGIGALAGWISGIGKPSDDELNARGMQAQDFSHLFGFNPDQLKDTGGLFDPRNSNQLNTFDNFFNNLMNYSGGNSDEAAKLSGELLDTRNTGNYMQGRNDLLGRLQQLQPDQLNSLFPSMAAPQDVTNNRPNSGRLIGNSQYSPDYQSAPYQQ